MRDIFSDMRNHVFTQPSEKRIREQQALLLEHENTMRSEIVSDLKRLLRDEIPQPPSEDVLTPIVARILEQVSRMKEDVARTHLHDLIVSRLREVHEEGASTSVRALENYLFALGTVAFKATDITTELIGLRLQNKVTWPGPKNLLSPLAPITYTPEGRD